MKRIISIFIFLLSGLSVFAQCSICTKTAQQLVNGPAHGMNSAIIYLAFIPLLVIAIVGYRWWKNEKTSRK
jgi:hypothetical protein